MKPFFSSGARARYILLGQDTGNLHPNDTMKRPREWDTMSPDERLEFVFTKHFKNNGPVMARDLTQGIERRERALVLDDLRDACTSEDDYLRLVCRMYEIRSQRMQ